MQDQIPNQKTIRHYSEIKLVKFQITRRLLQMEWIFLDLQHCRVVWVELTNLHSITDKDQTSQGHKKIKGNNNIS